ncbi:hypothetical protein HK104_010524 [Borealophlyctis nickersoniae]|nr:hypothetical protein HK104_010524 [Borealophlyctis nickersoniae]
MSNVAGRTEDQQQPLVYYESSYRSIGDEVFIEAFENATLSFDQWTHRAHLRMAWIYLQSEGSPEKAYVRVKEGIKNYTKTNIERVKHRYNETITIFFLRLIHLALDADRAMGIAPYSAANEDAFAEFLGRYPFLEDGRMMYGYYSKDVLHGDEAVEKWVEPDKQALPNSVEELLKGRTK